MKNIFVCFLIIVLFVSYGCKDESLCPEEYDMGSFELLPTSKDIFPYKDTVVNIVFKDSLGNEIEVIAKNLAKDKISFQSRLSGVVECIDDSLQEVKVFANTEQVTYLISVPAFDIGFHLMIRSAPYISRYDDKLVRDIGLIYYRDSLSFQLPNIYPPQFSFLIDIRNSGEFPFIDYSIPVLNLGGTDFMNVYNNSHGEDKIEFYYNHAFGLIGFNRKSDGVLYVFDRFE